MTYYIKYYKAAMRLVPQPTAFMLCISGVFCDDSVLKKKKKKKKTL